MSSAKRTAAIIGAGPSGLAAARWLREVGFATTIFEQNDNVGGQWCVGADEGHIWPGMHTNTSAVMTAFADLAHSPGTPVYPRAEAIGAYLRRYAEHTGVLADIQFRTRVLEVDPASSGDGWRVRVRDAHGREHEQHFSHVVAAPGRFRTPVMPEVPGLAAFTGSLGVSHAGAYRGPDAFRGRRVLVAGHNISAVEIGSELALAGAARVIVSARRHRYVLQRLMAGVPVEYRVYTRYAALAAETFPPAMNAAAIKAFVLRTSGHPRQFGAPCASEDVFEAGFTQNHYYLHLVAEGRITPRPWLTRIEGNVAHCADGTAEEVDAILCATGYAIDLPFLGPTLREVLRPDAQHVDLYEHVFHPELPGLAFVGMYAQTGPNFPTLELQARWVAYTWGGLCPPPTREAMEAGVAAYRARRGEPQLLRMHILARQLARAAGVEPNLAQWPELTRALMFGPLAPASFRLQGPHALPDAACRVLEQAAAYGAITDASLTREERAQLHALAEARNDVALDALASSNADER